MKLRVIFLLLFCCDLGPFHAQTPIVVTEQTIKIGANSEDSLFFGFAEGDEILFSYSEVNGKELKEIEILEYPSSSKFSEYKSARIENKAIRVSGKAIYKFRFCNGHLLAGRICKIKIQRAPVSEHTKNFVTNVRWTTKHDTVWNVYTKDIVVGYDTLKVQKTRKDLVGIDTTVTELFSKSERVHSETAIGKTQTSYIDVSLPNNVYAPDRSNPYYSREVIAWSYWLGVGQKADEEYYKANSALSQGVKALGVLTGYGALATLAVSGVSFFRSPAVGDNVQYRFITMQNGISRILDQGNGIAANGRNDRLLQGRFTIELFNDNFMDGIDVTVKVIAVQVAKRWEDRPYTEQVVTPRYEEQIFREPVIKSEKVLVMSE